MFLLTLTFNSRHLHGNSKSVTTEAGQVFELERLNGVIHVCRSSRDWRCRA